jgi:hypothetical protein
MRNTNNLKQDTSLLSSAVNKDSVIETEKPQSNFQKVPNRTESSDQG